MALIIENTLKIGAKTQQQAGVQPEPETPGNPSEAPETAPEDGNNDKNDA